MIVVRSAALAIVELALLASVLPASPSPGVKPSVPVIFEKAPGRETAFVARGAGFSVRLEERRAILEAAGPQHKPILLEMRLTGARPAKPEGRHRVGGEINYLVGPSSRWRRNVPGYSEVGYQHVYPGTDLVFHGRQGRLEYDFLVAPRADPSGIQVEWKGAKSLRIDDRGDLIISAGNGEVQWDAPVIYQKTGALPRSVSGGFRLLGRNRVGFRLDEYDHTLPLVIDPSLGFSTLLGGMVPNPLPAEYDVQTASRGMALDSQGNVYITGMSKSMTLPVTAGAYQTAFAGSTTAQVSGDAFVAKLTPTGSLVYLTYLGGRYDDVAFGIAVDSSGSAYVTGYTNSPDFPTTNGAFQTRYAGGSATAFFLIEGDAFVTKLSPDGKSLVYSTYLGGAQDDAGFGVAVDSAGNAYVSGSTQSPAFPVTTAAPQARYGGTGGQAIFPLFGQPVVSAGDAFIAKLNSSGTALVYSTFLGGSNDDAATSIAIDGTGAAYIGGYTLSSSNFPVTQGAFQTQYGGTGTTSNYFFNLGDGFVAKLNPAGSAFVYVTYIGGTGDDSVNSLTVDSTGAVYGTGSSTSSNFPLTSGAFQNSLAGPYSVPLTIDVVYGDAVVFKLNPAGSSLVFSSYCGGSGDDAGMGIALDSGGNVLVAGFTSSPDFPVTQNAAQGVLGAPSYLNGSHNDHTFGNGFLLELTPNGARQYATYLGGSVDNGLFSIAVTPTGTAWMSGAATVQTDAIVLSVAGFAGSVTGPTISSVVSASGEGPILAQNTWIEIKGQNLASTTRLWQGSDFVNGQMPTQIDGVSVLVDGKPAYVDYVSPTQVNALTPLDATTGQVPVQLTGPAGKTTANANLQAYAPGFFQFSGGPYVAATHANGSLLGPTSVFPGSSTPAHPGEIVILYANGFGQITPAIIAGSATQSGTLPSSPLVTIGGSTAAVQFAGAISPGLYQFNVQVPNTVASGDQPIVATYNGVSTQSGALITIQQ